MTEYKIKSIRKINKTHIKYDISIEKNHNYFANNILAHNSNFAACFDGDRLWVKSRNWFKREHEEDMWWFGANHAKLKEKLQKYPFLVFYGELTGLVQKFPYNSFVENGERCPVVNFFDLYDAKNKVWMSYEDRIRIFKELDLQMAPELYVGKFNKELIYSLAEGNSNLNSSHIKEGVVIDVISESPFRRCERKYKLIGCDYNLQKK